MVVLLGSKDSAHHKLCVAILQLSWRPKRAFRLAAPPAPQGAAFRWGAAAVIVALGVAFPLGGVAIMGVVASMQTIAREMTWAQKVKLSKTHTFVSPKWQNTSPSQPSGRLCEAHCAA